MNKIARCDWLPERVECSHLARSGLPALSRKKKFPRKPYNKSFIDQVCSVKMAEYWLRSQKKSLANIQPSSPHTWSITHIYLVVSCYYGSVVGVWHGDNVWRSTKQCTCQWWMTNIVRREKFVMVYRSNRPHVSMVYILLINPEWGHYIKAWVWDFPVMTERARLINYSSSSSSSSSSILFVPRGT